MGIFGMMEIRNKLRSTFFALALLLITLFTGVLLIPVQAAATFQGTPVPMVTAATAVIPNTGGNTATPVSLGWIAWIILGIAIIALIFALVTRSSSNMDI